MGFFDRMGQIFGDLFDRIGDYFSDDSAPDPVADTVESIVDEIEIIDNRDAEPTAQFDDSWFDHDENESFDGWARDSALANPLEWDSPNMIVHLEPGMGRIEYSVGGETQYTEYADIEDIFAYAEWLSDHYDIDYEKEIDS